jgi:DNA-binding transcriptional ArsR family regulator
MKPLFHPAVEDVTVEGLLYALADPVRVAIFTQIAGADCAQTCSNFLYVSNKTIPKSTLSQHFKALREAGLIHSERLGVEMHSTSRCAELDRRFPGLIRTILKAHQVQLDGEPRSSDALKRVRGKRRAARK